LLTVVDYELIRRQHLIDGQSQRKIAREPGHARNTVANATAPTRRVVYPMAGITNARPLFTRSCAEPNGCISCTTARCRG
jgi:hypothetical protein